MIDPYAVLGISKGATTEEIKAAYRKKAKECHPDLHPDDPSAQEKMNQVNQAYDMLTNPEKYRSAYGANGGASSSYGYENRNAYGGYYGYGGCRGYGYGSGQNDDDPDNPYRQYTRRRTVFRVPSIWKVILFFVVIRFIMNFFTMCMWGGGYLGR